MEYVVVYDALNDHLVDWFSVVTLLLLLLAVFILFKTICLRIKQKRTDSKRIYVSIGDPILFLGVIFVAVVVSLTAIYGKKVKIKQAADRNQIEFVEGILRVEKISPYQHKLSIGQREFSVGTRRYGFLRFTNFCNPDCRVADGMTVKISYLENDIIKVVVLNKIGL